MEGESKRKEKKKVKWRENLTSIFLVVWREKVKEKKKGEMEGKINKYT